MNTGEIERVIIHANVCLKRWDANRRSDDLQVRSMILGWLNKVYTRSHGGYNDWRNRKAFARGLRDSFNFTLNRVESDIHITSITVRNPVDGSTLAFPQVDFSKLNEEAKKLLDYIPPVRNIDGVSFKEIESIKFS